MFDSYRRVLGLPGAPAFTAAGIVLRLPLAMYPVSLVLLVSLGTGNYGAGGFLTAAYIAGSAAGNPVLSRLADQAGQRWVLVPAALVHVLAVAALLATVKAGASTAAQALPAMAVGASYPPVGALVRTRWMVLLAATPDRFQTALSLESTLDELTWVTGPMVATVLATAVDPAVPFVLTALLVLVGAVALHASRSSAPASSTMSRSDRRPLPRAATVAIVLTAAATGTTLLSIDLGAIAYVGQAGQARWTGAVAACFSLGSGLAGLGYGVRHWQLPVERRLLGVLVVFALLPVVFLVVTSVPVLAVAMLLAGSGTAPLLITLFGALERIAPAERLTEAMSWVSTGINVGAGLAAPLVGVVAQLHGARVALLMPLVAAMATGGLGWVAVRLMRRALVPVEAGQLSVEATAPITGP